MTLRQVLRHANSEPKAVHFKNLADVFLISTARENHRKTELPRKGEGDRKIADLCSWQYHNRHLAAESLEQQ